MKKELFATATDLQKKLGKKVPLNDAIRRLIKSLEARERDIPLFLSLYGALGPGRDAKEILAQLRNEGDRHLERIAMKHSA